MHTRLFLFESRGHSFTYTGRLARISGVEQIWFPNFYSHSVAYLPVFWTYHVGNKIAVIENLGATLVGKRSNQ